MTKTRKRESRSFLAISAYCLLAVGLAFFSLKAAATDWQAIGQSGGSSQAVAVQGGTVYAGEGSRLITLNASNPRSPSLLGATAPFSDDVQAIAIAGNSAYVAVGAAGFGVVSIVDPAHPVILGTLDTRGYAEGIAVAGTTVYLADGPDGLRIINAADSVRPVEIASVFPFNYAFDVVVSGRYAYIAAGGAGLLIADVSNPYAPLEVGSYDTSGHAYGLALMGNTIYIADAWGGIRVVDVSNPAQPTLLSSYSTPGWALSVAAVGTTLYAACGANGIRLLDGASSTAIREMGAYAGSGFARRVAVSGGMVYVADTVQGLQVVDAANLTQPVELGEYAGIVEARWIAVSGNHAYVAGGKSGNLSVLDISNLTSPRRSGVFQAAGYASGVMVSGNYAYLTTFEDAPNYLWAIDISDPTRPVQVGVFPIASLSPATGAAREAALQGNYIYVADEYGLRIFDISVPANIRNVGQLQLNDSGQDTIGIAVSGNYAYIAGAMAGVRIVDIGTPASPRLVGGFSTSGFNYSVAVSGTRLYAGNGDGTVQVVDVADPAHPVELGRYRSMGAVYGLTVVGNRLFVSNGGGGVQVLDISNPAVLTLAASLAAPGDARQTVFLGSTLYVAGGSGGVIIYSSSADPIARGLAPGSASSGFGSQIWQRASPASTGQPLPADQPKPSSSAPTVANMRSSTCTVTSTADSGAGSLRDCLTTAAAGSVIVFSTSVFPPGSPATIYLQSPLPALSAGSVTLDASNAGVVLDGNYSTDNGIKIVSSNNRIMGLQIANFTGDGLLIEYPSQFNQIGGDRFSGGGPSGQGNVFTGNVNGIRALYASYNTIIGNMIGTDASGTVAQGNQWGVVLSDEATHHRIGGLTVGERNIISGNSRTGVDLMGSTAHNSIVGNYIGTDVTGMIAIPNGSSGVVIETGATNNTVGGTTSAERNIVSGNSLHGVVLSDSRSVQNSVIGNYIGTNVSGTAALPNGDGVLVWGPGFNRIGGTQSGEGNLVSGNQYVGISIGGLTPRNVAIIGNVIGRDASGNRMLGNGSSGIYLYEGVQHNFVGGLSSAESNVVRGNMTGIELAQPGTKHNLVAGNQVGNNTSSGIYVQDYAASNFLLKNNVTGNASGIVVSAGLFNALRGNAVTGNSGTGILLEDGGNQMLAVPVIAYGNMRNIWGTACADCVVDIFSDSNDEGATYEGSVLTDAAGAFAFPGTASLSGPKITATSTDPLGNTSQFSTPYTGNSVPPHITRSDCLFDWAERMYPTLFAAAGAESNILSSYYYRYYSQTATYLGTSSLDSHLYFLGPPSGNALLDVGTLSTWLATAGCQ